MAGHSLGELSALAAAGAIDELEALRLVVLRGELMAQSGEASGGGTMLVLVGANPGRARSLAARYGVTVANDNAPDQVVLSGGRRAAQARARRGQGRRAARDAARRRRRLPLAADGRRRRAVPRCARAGELPRADRARRVVCDRACRSAIPPPSSPHALASPVRWRETMLALERDGVRTYVDVGPGNVLAKLVSRNVSGAAATGPETLLEAADALA